MTATTPRNIELSPRIRHQIHDKLFYPEHRPWLYVGTLDAGHSWNIAWPVPNPMGGFPELVQMFRVTLVMPGRKKNRIVDVYVGQSVKSQTIYWARKES